MKEMGLKRMGDWRIRWQSEYLQNKTFVFKKIETDDHEHCEFCFDKVCKDDNIEGYMTLNHAYYVCRECFNDFEKDFGFKVFKTEDFNNRKITEILKSECNCCAGDNLYILDHIINVLKNLSGAVFIQENILIAPFYVTFHIKQNSEYVEIKNRKVNICIKDANDFLHSLNNICDLNYKSEGTNVRVCISIESQE